MPGNSENLYIPGHRSQTEKFDIGYDNTVWDHDLDGEKPCDCRTDFAYKYEPCEKHKVK